MERTEEGFFFFFLCSGSLEPRNIGLSMNVLSLLRGNGSGSKTDPGPGSLQTEERKGGALHAARSRDKVGEVLRYFR